MFSYTTGGKKIVLLYYRRKKNNFSYIAGEEGVVYHTLGGNELFSFISVGEGLFSYSARGKGVFFYTAKKGIILYTILLEGKGYSPIL